MPRTAVLIPCHNEEVTVAKVVADYRSALPDADVYVYDNNSTDRTSEIVTEIALHDPRSTCGTSTVRARAMSSTRCSGRSTPTAT